MSVFGAINRFISRLDSDSPVQNAGITHGAFGFQVLRNKNLEIPIEPWYDFVIGINGRQIVRISQYQAHASCLTLCRTTLTRTFLVLRFATALAPP